MSAGQTNLQLCGFGGQGIVLAAVIFGTTAVTKAGMNAVQTQSSSERPLSPRPA